MGRPQRRLHLSLSLPPNTPIHSTSSGSAVFTYASEFPDIEIVEPTTAAMISDGDLFSLAIFFGSASMILIVLYHFLEINAFSDAGVLKKAE
ncbi:hypothetical protein RJ55_00547 [Drechmeria coniospora]|nr:hypothetical protein RJ55_00547 [Drechmeria coniospora]